jgi:hypothetical protein
MSYPRDGELADTPAVGAIVEKCRRRYLEYCAGSSMWTGEASRDVSLGEDPEGTFIARSYRLDALHRMSLPCFT